MTRSVTVNASDYLRAAAERDPDGTAIIEASTGRSISWAEFDQWADTVAQTLLGRGLVAGHRVALVMTNGIDLSVAYFGVLRGGLIAVPINPRATAREVSRVVNDCQPKLVVADAHAIDVVRQADLGAAYIVTHGAAAESGEIRFSELLEYADTSAPISPRDPEATAVVLYTSGATGLPRGVMLSHRALIANIEQVAALEPPIIGADDVVLGLLPLFHIYGLNCVLGQSVRVGATVVMVESFSATSTLEIIVEQGVTSVPVAPPVIAAWAGLDQLAQSLAGVRLILSGASPLDNDLAELFYETSGHYVEQGYGLTESAPVIATTLTQSREPGTAPHPDSVGKPLPGVEIRLLDTLGQPAAVTDPAQIFVRGDNLFSGYWPDGADGPDEDGWYGTGDLGILSEDGEIIIVDRLRELVIVSGFNVYPSEVEDVIAGMAEIEEVAVVGLADARTGESVVAFVVPSEGYTGDDATLTRSVIDYSREQLARFKVPTKVVIVSGLPHSPTGKVAKGRLRSFVRGDDLNFTRTTSSVGEPNA